MPAKREVGKNQPCWCGSGRKYKLCCIWKERSVRKVESTVHKCEHGHPLIANFTNNPLFQMLNYERPLRYFAREQGLYLFSTLTGGQQEQLVAELQANTLTKKKLLEAYRSHLTREQAMLVLAHAGRNFTVFSARHHILREGFRSHFNRKYVLSIPCLLPQVEGMLAEVGMDPAKVKTPAVRADGYERRLAFEIQDYAKEFNAFLAEVFTGHGAPDVFNRNPILHGANPRYDQEDWSMLVVLTILEIHYFLWYREKLPVVIP